MLKPFRLTTEDKIHLARLISGAALYALALSNVLPFAANVIVYLVCLIIFGADVIYEAITNILHGELFDENFLMTVSTVGAFCIQQFPEAVAVMAFYQIGEFLQDMAVDRSRRSIKSLMNLKPDVVHMASSGLSSDKLPSDVAVGELILVKPGERIPLDGVVIDGTSALDMSSLTGESVPVQVGPSETVLSGAVNLSGLLKIRVQKPENESTVTKIMDLVENAASKKAPTEKFITKFAKIYTPAVVSAALIIAFIAPLVLPGTFTQWVYRALVFLVVSCPCALVVSVPLTFFSGIGASSRKGVLVKGGNYLQALSEVNVVVFDKTGTLTKGVFDVNELLPANGVSELQLLRAAAIAEENSLHPIGVSIVRAFNERYGPIKAEATDYREISGMGVSALSRGQKILAGSAQWMKENGVMAQEITNTGALVYVAQGGKFLGCVVISDELKPDAATAIAQLKALGVSRTVMLTGDRKSTAEIVGRHIGIDDVYSQLLPYEKVERLERIASELPGSKVMFVGDGINDAPVLARAEVGAAMGGVGSDAAVEAADVVIMNDEPSKIPLAIRIARSTMRIVKQNITFALAVKFIVLLLAVFGYATMWMAVFADVGVEALVVLNAMRRKV
jgi:Cd2+/Zn2+-exporting ATPase